MKPLVDREMALLFMLLHRQIGIIGKTRGASMSGSLIIEAYTYTILHLRFHCVRSMSVIITFSQSLCLKRSIFKPELK